LKEKEKIAAGEDCEQFGAVSRAALNFRNAFHGLFLSCFWLRSDAERVDFLGTFACVLHPTTAGPVNHRSLASLRLRRRAFVSLDALRCAAVDQRNMRSAAPDGAERLRVFDADEVFAWSSSRTFKLRNVVNFEIAKRITRPDRSWLMQRHNCRFVVVRRFVAPAQPSLQLRQRPLPVLPTGACARPDDTADHRQPHSGDGESHFPLRRCPGVGHDDHAARPCPKDSVADTDT
jgi:hypothetical protein